MVFFFHVTPSLSPLLKSNRIESIDSPWMMHRAGFVPNHHLPPHFFVLKISHKRTNAHKTQESEYLPVGGARRCIGLNRPEKQNAQVRVETLIFRDVGKHVGYAPAQITLTDGPDALVQAVGPADMGMSFPSLSLQRPFFFLFFFSFLREDFPRSPLPDLACLFLLFELVSVCLSLCFGIPANYVLCDIAGGRFFSKFFKYIGGIKECVQTASHFDTPATTFFSIIL